MSSKRRSSSRTRTVSIPINGPIEHNAPIYAVIGQLIVNWANNESVFQAMLQNLIDSKSHRQAVIIWHSHKNTRNRLQLIKTLSAATLTDYELYKQVVKECNHFYNLTKVRNFYCHAIYHFRSDLALVSAQSFNLTDSDFDEEVVKQENKLFTPQTLNEMNDVSLRLAENNRNLWAIVEQIGENTGQRHAHIPQIVQDQQTTE